MEKTKEISVFVDESGSFDPDRSSSRYYLVCMVFHNQECDISRQIGILEQNLELMGLPRNHCVHAGPLKEYAHLSSQERRGIFDRMMVFLLPSMRRGRIHLHHRHWPHLPARQAEALA